jgi:hypothetical protein
MTFITPVKRATLKAKATKHYKNHFDVQHLGSGDSNSIEWALQLIEHLYPGAVKAIPQPTSTT